MKYLSQILKTYSNKYLLVSLLIVLLCPILAFSYSSFIETSNNYKSNEMMIGNLLYSMKINDISTSSINCAPGETEAVVEITTLSDMETKYKLVYPITEGISIVYASDENEPAFGGILTTRKISIMINNTTGSNITINFGVTGGYNHNDLSDVIIPDGYNEITSSYIKYDMKLLSLFVDGTRVTELNSNQKYSLLSYACYNEDGTSNTNVTLTWRSHTSTASISNILQPVKCNVYLSSTEPVYDYGDGTKNTTISGNYNIFINGTNILLNNYAYVSGTTDYNYGITCGNISSVSSGGRVLSSSTTSNVPWESIINTSSLNNAGDKSLIRSGLNNYSFSKTVPSNYTLSFIISGGYSSGSYSVSSLKFNVNGTYYSLKQMVTNNYIKPLVAIYDFGLNIASGTIGVFPNLLNLYDAGSTNNSQYGSAGFILMTNVSISGFQINSSKTTGNNHVSDADGWLARMTPTSNYRLTLNSY